MLQLLARLGQVRSLHSYNLTSRSRQPWLRHSSIQRSSRSFFRLSLRSSFISHK